MATPTIEELKQFLIDEVAVRQLQLDTAKAERVGYVLATDRASFDPIISEEQNRTVVTLKGEIDLLQVVRQFVNGGLSAEAR